MKQEVATYNVDFKTGKITATSAWGDGDLTTQRGLLDHVIKQLTHFLVTKQSPDEAYTKRDLDGYKAVWDTGSEKLAKEFFDVKNKAKESGKPFPDNLAIVAHMKANGLWRPL